MGFNSSFKGLNNWRGTSGGKLEGEIFSISTSPKLLSLGMHITWLF
jgi:hypothetical protein